MMSETEILKIALVVSLILLQVLMFFGISFILKSLSKIEKELKKLNRRNEQQSR
jgi:cell division protein FtsB